MRRLTIFLVLAMVASACGSAAGPNLIAAGSSTDSVTAESSKKPASSAPPTALASGVDSRCETMVGMFVGPDNLVESSDDDAAIARISELLELFDEQMAGRWQQLTDADPAEVELAEFLALYSAVDDVTFAACEIPLVTATGSMSAATISRFCEIDITTGAEADPVEGNPPCIEDEPELPQHLPCFAAISTAQTNFAGRYDAVDCDTGETVGWDPYAGQWIPRGDSPFDDLDSFEEIDMTVVTSSP